MTKTDQMNAALDLLTQQMFGRTRSSAMASGICVTCGKDVTEFRNKISEKEWTISGMCQNCQDSTFGID